MSTGQRIIKYLALALGIFLSLLIIFSIVNAFLVVFDISTGFNDISNNILEKIQINSDSDNLFTQDFSSEYENVKSIEIVSSVSKLNIKKSNTFKVEASNVTDEFSSNLSNDGKLVICDTLKENIKIKNNSKGQEITIYLKDGEIIDNINITTGVSNSYFENINADNLELKIGAGNIECSNININNSSEITGGVGNLNISKSTFNNLVLKLGVGNSDIECKLLGNSTIKCGLGDIDLNINGKEEEYTITGKTGLGNIKIDNKKIKNKDIKIGTGENIISIEGGLGNTSIYFNNIEYINK